MSGVRWWVLLGIILVSTPARGLENVSVRPDPARPGDILVIEATHKPSRATLALHGLRFVRWNGRSRALAGLDLGADPQRPPLLEAHWTYAPPVRRRIKIRPKRFPREELKVAPKYVAPPAEVQERIWAEKQRLDLLWRSRVKAPLWRQGFRRPVSGKIKSAFGLQRIFNGEPRSPHSGVDLGGPLGTPVVAANDGNVVLADALYFTGNTVVLDHGLGVMTLYAHLQKLKVHAGRRVARGAVLGYVGATGRATGPHLHWGARIMQARVDPLQLLALKPFEEGK